MKIYRPRFLTAAVIGLAAYSSVRCAERKPLTAASVTPAEHEITAAAGPDAPATKWSDIKDIAFDQRVQFFAGLKVIETAVDAQIAELTARRGAMTSKTDTKDWDFAMKEMIESRAYLQSTGEALGSATPETWPQGKDKVGAAWERTQAAYTKVKSSTTS